MVRRMSLVIALASCASGPTRSADPYRFAIVAAEGGPQGLRLVAIDERGDRRFTLVAPGDPPGQDKNPAISPDGHWMVFASTRGRKNDATRLWIVALGPRADAVPRPLTDAAADAIDTHPTWTPDGKAIVFASTRDGPDFDLWRLPIDRQGRPGKPAQLTTEIDHEVTPSVATDGTIVYASVAQIGVREVTSRLYERSPDGHVRVLTDGPADSSPAVSPDGRTIVFARPAIHDGKAHSELFRMTRGSQTSTPLVWLPLTDESGPVWSRDGRFVFATSILRGANGSALFSSIVHVDLSERQPRARILRDRAGAAPRLTPAIPLAKLDAAALRADPDYLPELAKIMASKIRRAQERDERERQHHP